MKKALIAGVCGRDGAYLLGLGYETHGGRRRSSLDGEKRLRTLKIKQSLRFVYFDTTFYRSAEVDLLLGDASEAKSVLGNQEQPSVKDLTGIMSKPDYELISRHQ